MRSVTMYPYKMLIVIILSCSVVGQYAIASWGWMFGHSEQIVIKKTRSVHFAEETQEIDSQTTAGDGLDTVDSGVVTKEEDTGHKGLIWMVIAFPIFLLYWAFIGLPLGEVMIGYHQCVCVCLITWSNYRLTSNPHI